MSKHWVPDEHLAHRAGADEPARSAKAAWPEGATVGIAMVAAFCLTIGLLLYHAAGPRDPIEESVAQR